MATFKEFEHLPSTLLADTTQGKENPGHSERTVPNMGFLDLPREIRDLIYKLMFFPQHHQPFDPMHPDSCARLDISQFTSLLLTNHQIYHESIEILYTYTTFQLHLRSAHEFMYMLAHQTLIQPSDIDTPGCTRHEESSRQGGHSSVCVARFYVRRLHIIYRSRSLHRLEQLFALLENFPNLELVRIIQYYKNRDMQNKIFNMCCELGHERPSLRVQISGK